METIVDYFIINNIVKLMLLFILMCSYLFIINELYKWLKVYIRINKSIKKSIRILEHIQICFLHICCTFLIIAFSINDSGLFYLLNILLIKGFYVIVFLLLFSNIKLYTHLKNERLDYK